MSGYSCVKFGKNCMRCKEFLQFFTKIYENNERIAEISSRFWENRTELMGKFWENLMKFWWDFRTFWKNVYASWKIVEKFWKNPKFSMFLINFLPLESRGQGVDAFNGHDIILIYKIVFSLFFSLFRDTFFM